MALNIADYMVTETDGSFRISDFHYAAWPEGSDVNAVAPVQGPSTMPRNAFTLVAGTVDCYTASLPALMPTTARLISAIKARRTGTATVPAAESPYAASQNSFSFAPSVLAAPGRPVLSR
jgi:hypothetical protein